MRSSFLWTAVSLSGWVGIWFAISLSGLVDSTFLTPPWVIAQEFWRLMHEGYAGSSLYTHFTVSLFRTLLGFLLAVLIAVPLGLLMGMNRVVFAIFNPLITMLRPIPAIAFIPLVILWFGIGEMSKVLVIFLSGFLYIILSTEAGVLQIPIGYKRVALNLGATELQMFWRVILPGAAPSIMTGIRTGLAISWAVVVAAELIAAQAGLGYLIMDGTTFFRIPVVYIGVLLIGGVGFCLELLVSRLEHRLIHWRGR